MVQRTFVEGGIANEAGDLYGNSPLRIIRWGAVTIASERAGAAIMMGWRAVEKLHPDADPEFAWLERTEKEREVML